MRSTKGFRVGLKFRETAHENELTFNTSQTDEIEEQIRDLQQSMEVSRTERTNPTTRHQHDKVSTEAEIDRLLEEVIALV